jgi:ATP-dependent Lon protease
MHLFSAVPANEDGKLLSLHETLTGLPFGISIPPNSNIAQVGSRLDATLYGLVEVKHAIRIELILAAHATGRMHPTPLLLVGPPGTGKTAVAEAVASALDLPFVRISLAGHCDVVHLKGSAFSWSSSGPGIIVQSLIATKSQAAIVLLDECDKSGGYSNSNVTNVLAELLDPDQCHRYQDLFLSGLPIDLSEIIWVLTANDLEKVPDFVQNRCKAIHLRNYTAEEKLVIIRDFFPKQIVKHRGFDFSISVGLDVAQRLAAEANSLREAKRMLTEMIAGALERKSPGTFRHLSVDTWDDAVVTKEPDPPRIGFDV